MAKIKRCGADAVKLLAQFEPDEFGQRRAELRLRPPKSTSECIEHDILFLLEPIHFAYNGEDAKSDAVLKRKPTTVIESARVLSRYCDVYKAEFPGTYGYESDSVQMDNLKRLNDACSKPWVLLSAGVKYPEYKKQVEMAMKAGCSGILGGRAFWTEFFTYPDAAARQKFADTECVGRVKELDAIVRAGTPWFAKYGYTQDQLAGLRAAEGWHARYGGGAAGEKAKVEAGGVY